MKACLNQSTVMQCSIPEFIKLSSRAGFTQVELRVPKVEEYLADNSCRQLTDLCQKHEVHIAALNSLESFSLVPEENWQFMIKKAQEAITLCELIGCELLILVPSKNLHHLSSSKIRERTVHRLQIISDLAGEHNLKVSLEPIGFTGFSIRDINEALELAADINTQQVTLILDTFHFHIAGSSVDELQKIPGDRISLVHCEDVPDISSEKLQDKHRLFPGEGIMRLEGLCQTLKSIGYQGALSVELFDPKLWRMSPDKVIKRAWQSLQKYL